MLTPFDQLVLEVASAIVAEGGYPTIPMIRSRLRGPTTPGLSKFYIVVARLQSAGLFPAERNRRKASKSGYRHHVDQKVKIDPVEVKPDRYLGPFADDMRRVARVRRWARKTARKPREVIA